MSERMRLQVELTIENGQFKAEIVNSEQLTKKLGQTGQQSFGALGEAASRVDGPIGRVTRSMQGLVGMTSRWSIALYGGLAALTAWGAGVLKGTAIAGEHERQLKRLEAQVRATGMAAGRSVEQLDEQAEQLSRVTLFDDDEIRKAQGILLTFKSVTGEIFDETIETAADLAEVMGTDLSSAVLQLGKALEDPEQGLTALTRSGVSFNSAQKETIKGLAETGQKGKALEMILATVNDQLGPAARGAAEGYAGAMNRVTKSWNDFLEALGRRDDMQWWLEKIDQALKGLSDLAVENEREEFDRLFAEREKVLNSPMVSDASIAAARRDPTSWLSIVEGRMAQLQDREVARQRGASGGGSAGAGGGDTGRPTAEYEREVRDQIRALNEEILEQGRAERDTIQDVIDTYDEAGAAARQRTEDIIILQEAAAAGDERAITALNNMALGITEVTEVTENATDVLNVFGDEAARNIHNIGVALLRGKAIGESFFESMLSGFADMAAEIAMSAWLRSLFNGLAGSDTGWIAAIGSFFGGKATVGHTGGVIGHDALPSRAVPAFAFAGAPRYHSGLMPSWLGPNERPAILQEGEGVFTPAQMRALGGGRRGDLNVTYHINASGGTSAQQIQLLHQVLRENNRRLLEHEEQRRLRGD